MHAFLFGFRFFICFSFLVFIFISFLVCLEREKEMGRDRSPKDPGRSFSLDEVEGMFSVCCFEISRDQQNTQRLLQRDYRVSRNREQPALSLQTNREKATAKQPENDVFGYLNIV